LSDYIKSKTKIYSKKEMGINKDYIKQLSGIRIFAAIWIFFYHISFVYGFYTSFSALIQWGWLKDIISKGSYGVEIFFISSGFVIPYVYMGKFSKGLIFENVRSFYIFRLSKIYPLYLSTLIITWLLYQLGILDNPMFKVNGSIFLNLTLMQNWVLEKLISWNSPAWALSAEWFLYIVFPLFALFFSKIQKSWVLFLVFLSMTYAYYIFLKNTPQFVAVFTPPFLGAASLFRSGYCFFCGSVLFKLYEKKILAKLSGDIIFIIISAGIVYLFFSDIRREYEIISVTILLSTLIYALIRSKNIILFFFSNPVIAYLAKLSFAFYLLHYPMIQFINYVYLKGGISIKSPMLHLCALTLIMLIFSALLYHLIEVKCQELIRQMYSGKKRFDSHDRNQSVMY
jgi:peptidoglycan/LPS O-acetylase OafA/YrhL